MNAGPFVKFLQALGVPLLGACRDLSPIVAVIAIFQILVLRQPLPELMSVLAGLALVILGLALFVLGLDIGLFPLGETLAEEFAQKGSLFWLLLFAFALGFGTRVAEPALIAVTREGARAAAEAGLIASSSDAIGRYAMHVRLTVALCNYNELDAARPKLGHLIYVRANQQEGRSYSIIQFFGAIQFYCELGLATKGDDYSILATHNPISHEEYFREVVAVDYEQPPKFLSAKDWKNGVAARFESWRQELVEHFGDQAPINFAVNI